MTAAVSAETQLANFRAVTDSELGRLDVEDLLVELLERVRGILDADTAAVLLLDKDSGDLVARAACGIEEEVRQGVRVPVGVGFAGRIARSKEPVRPGSGRLHHGGESDPVGEGYPGHAWRAAPGG